MLTVFRYSLRTLRGQILGWGIGLALVGMMLVSMYDSIAASADELEAYLEVFPEEFMAFFGEFTSFSTPEGYLGIEFFSYMPLILGIFSVLIGSGLLVSDEEAGTLDLILGHPVSRSALFFGRLLGFLCASVGILVLTWVGFALPLGSSAMDIGWVQLAQPLLALLAQVLLFGALALFLSMVLPSRRLAATTAGLLLVASFFITGFANIDESLEPAAKLSPITYYQAQEAFDGLNGEWMAGLLGAAVAFSVLSWLLFHRRDIRVGGEGGWRLPSLPFRRRASSAE